MTNHAQDGRIGDNLLGVGNACIRVGLVVIRSQLYFETHGFQGSLELLESQFCAVLDVDADGCLWNAEYGAWRLVRYTPQGKVDRTLDVPVANPTCCCFGGDDLGTLYVTTATQRLTPEDLLRQPLAGSVLALRPGVRGLPESRFAG